MPDDDLPIARHRSARRAVDQARDELTELRGPAGLPRRTTLVLAVVTVVVAALVGAAAWWFASAPTQHSDDEFIAATTARVTLLLEADSTDPARARRILSGATGGFHDSFAQSADAYTEYVKTAGTSGAGTVDGVALARREGDSALMLVAASVRVATSDGTDDAASDFRMRVLMTPEGGQLKIEALEVLS